MISRATLQNVVAILLAGALLVPVFSYAQTDDRAPRGDRAGAFCDNLETIRDNMVAKIDERKGANFDKRGTRKAEFDANRDSRLADLDTKRSEADALRDERYANLRDRAETDAQKSAVDTFESTVEALVVDRRAEVDAAIAVFEATIEDLKSEADAAIGDFASDIEDAFESIFDDAQSSCDNDEDPATVRDQLRTDLEAARADFKTQRSAYEFKDDLEAARATRQSAFETARTTFQTGLEAAKEDLKAAFGA